MEVEVIDLKFQGHERAIAAFLIRGPEGVFLIESGPESCRDRLLSELNARGVSPSDLKGLFVTHIHLDHAGAAGWFAEQDVPVYVHPKGAKHLVAPEKLEASARQVYGASFDALWGGLAPAPEESVHILEDGEIAELAGLKVLALDTPGHAFHHLAYAIDGCVFAGDAAGARIDDSGFISVTSAPPQFHLEHTLASIEKIRSQDPKALYLTHFGPVADPQQHLSEYRDAVELNAEFVRMRLEEKMDSDSLAIAYQAFVMEQAFRHQLPRSQWETIQAINGTGMCADGIRMYWERELAEQT